MNGTEKTAAATAGSHARFTIFARTAPLLIEILEPLMAEAPELLHANPVSDAIFALALVKWPSLKKGGRTHPEMDEKTVYAIWAKSFHFWSRNRPKAMTVKLRGQQWYVWPFLETCLRHLFPQLPERLRIPYDLERISAFRDPKKRLCLSTIARLIRVPTQQPR